MAVKERMSLHMRITTTPEINSKEMIWFKGKTGEVRPAATTREQFRVFSDEPLVDDKMVIHTHLIGQKENVSQMGPRRREMPESLPSCEDFLLFLERMDRFSMRTSVVVSIDTSGAVIGSTHVRATKRFVELAKTAEDYCYQGKKQRLRSKKEKFSYAKYLMEQAVNWGQTYTRLMTAIKLFMDAGLQVRVCPAMGYEFDGMKFVKKY